jgi:hypothetical protein
MSQQYDYGNWNSSAFIISAYLGMTFLDEEAACFLLKKHLIALLLTTST